MTTNTSFDVDDVAVIGRTFEEYCRFFDLEPADLVGRTVLDCPSGAASFVASAHEHGIDATGADVTYRHSPSSLTRLCREEYDEMYAQLATQPDVFNWEEYGGLEERARCLREAKEVFLADYPEGRLAGRYAYAALPELPFASESFSLVLSAHFLFLYGDRFDAAFHRESLRELVRVARDEVRVYPLVGLDGERYPELEALLETLTDDGARARVRETPFEFFRGANELLVIEP
ncbi:hypothetical protein [Natronobiforma cellulositropha]|uniref:hypothetical protein n=1 Tax=Natronobiforma cellulositropha TaxID=1679076 RepID=UPI0021D574EB|nr:hypothetical protein [Natronobiforma cellulositropha]